MDNEIEVSAGRGELVAYYLTVLLIGIVVLYPAAIQLIGELSDDKNARMLLRLSYVQRLALGFLAFLPALSGLGLNLQFSQKSFLVGLGFAIFGSVVLFQAFLLSPEEHLDFSRISLSYLILSFLVQSAFWAGITIGLGEAGLALRRRLIASRLWRISGGIALLLLVLGGVVLAIVKYQRTGPLSIEDAIIQLADYRIATGRGSVVAVESYGPPNQKLAQIITLRLDSGAKLVIVEEPEILVGIAPDLSDISVGDTVQFRGRFRHLIDDPYYVQSFERRYRAFDARINASYAVVIADTYEYDLNDGYVRTVD